MQRLLPICVVLLLHSQAPGDDWPRWFGPHDNDEWHETGLLSKFPAGGPRVVWRTEIDSGYSGPSVSDGRLFVSDFARRNRREGEDRRTTFGTERVLCKNISTGATIWKHEYAVGYRVSYPEGPRTTPTVDGDRVYSLGTMGHLICFDAGTGDVIWSKNLRRIYGCRQPVWGYSIHPIIDGDRLICAVGGQGSALVAFNKLDGAEIWRALTAKEIGYAPPVFVETKENRQLVFWHDVAVVGLNPESGEQLWRVEFPIGKEPNPQQPATPIATPRVIGNRVLISSYFDGCILLEVSPDSAKTVWVASTEEKEHKDGLNSLMTTPVVRDGHFYGVSGDGELRCLTLDNYKLVWRDWALVSGKTAHFGTAFMVRNEDRYFVWNDQGELVIASLTPKGYTEIDRAKLLDPGFGARGRKVTWSHPAFSDGHMYVRNFKELICVDLRANASSEKADSKPRPVEDKGEKNDG